MGDHEISEAGERDRELRGNQAVIEYRLTAAEKRITQLERDINLKLEALEKQVQLLVTQTAVLDLRAGIWGALAGSIPALVVVGVMLLRGH